MAMRLFLCPIPLQVLEMLRKRGECSGENFDAMGLLQTLCTVKTDNPDGTKSTDAAEKRDQEKTEAVDASSVAASLKSGGDGQKSAAGNNGKMETEMKGENREVSL